jgi:hypothetical protein
MVHDYWIYRGDDEFTRQFLPGIGDVLGWWERQVKARGDQPVPWSWSSNAISDKLLFSLTLQQSAELFEHFGEEPRSRITTVNWPRRSTARPTRRNSIRSAACCGIRRSVAIRRR